MARRAEARRRLGPIALLLASGGGILAQPAGEPSPVKFTEVESRSVRRSVTLPGTVESSAASAVAGEVAGLVEKVAAREGQSVARGAPLVLLRKTELELRLRAARAQRREAAARLELAEHNLGRARELFDSGVISRRDHDDATSEFAAWQGRTDTLDAEIARVELDLERCTIRAPFGGVVVQERTEVGQWVDTGEAVIDLVVLDRLEVRVDVPEAYFPQLTPGEIASVRFEALPGLEIEGRVTTVVPRAVPDARTFPVKLAIPNRDRSVGVGMLAQVSLPLGAPYEATLVPKDAVVQQGTRHFVYKINGDEIVEQVDVAPGRGVGAWVVVDGGIEPGQRVVTRGNERLRAGQAVRGEPLRYDLP